MINEFEAHDDYRDERQRFRKNELDPRLSESEVTFLDGQLTTLIRKARRGEISFCGRDPEATVMNSCDFLYELRPRFQTSLRRPRREVRLYCAEPEAVQSLILGLHLATKPGDGPDLQHEQQAAIQESRNRANDWESSHAAD